MIKNLQLRRAFVLGFGSFLERLHFLFSFSVPLPLSAFGRIVFSLEKFHVAFEGLFRREQTLLFELSEEGRSLTQTSDSFFSGEFKEFANPFLSRKRDACPGVSLKKDGAGRFRGRELPIVADGAMPRSNTT